MAYDLAITDQPHLMDTPVEELTLEQVAQGHCILKRVGKTLDSRLKEFRAPIEAQAKQGEASEKGHLESVVGDTKVTYQKKVSETVNVDAALDMLERKGIRHLAADPVLTLKDGVDPNDTKPKELLEELAKYFDMKWKLDTKRLEALIVARIVLKEDVGDLISSEVNWALVVKPTGELKKLLA